MTVPGEFSSPSLFSSLLLAIYVPAVERAARLPALADCRNQLWARSSALGFTPRTHALFLHTLLLLGITRPHLPSHPPLPLQLSFIVLNPGEPERCAQADFFMPGP